MRALSQIDTIICIRAVRQSAATSGTAAPQRQVRQATTLPSTLRQGRQPLVSGGGVAAGQDQQGGARSRRSLDRADRGAWERSVSGRADS